MREQGWFSDDGKMPFFDENTNRRTRVYIAVITLIGFLSLTSSLWILVWAPSTEPSGWILLLGLTAIGSLLPIQIPSSRQDQGIIITFSDIFFFVAILKFEPSVAVCVVTLDSTLANLRARAQIKTWGKALFNICQMSLSGFVAAWFFHFLQGVPPPDISHETVLVLLNLALTMLVFYVVNSGSVAIAVAFYTQQPLVTVWRKNFLWTAIGNITGALIAALIVLNFDNNPVLAATVALPIGIVTYWSVRTYRRHVEELIRSSQFLQSTLNSVSAYISILDKRGVIVAVNRIWEGFAKENRLVGPMGEPGENLPSLLREVSGEEREKAERIIRGISDTADAHIPGFSLEYSCGRGRSRQWFGLQVSRFLDDNQVRVVVEFADITARKNLEEQLRHAQKMEAIGRLAGGVAHDFNNILTIISGYGTFLQEAVGEDEKLSRHVDTILEAAERAGAVTRQLLAFSRKQVLEPQVVELNRLVMETEKLLRRLIGEDISLITDLDAAAGKIRVDPGQFAQVLINLAVNARDAMPVGGEIRIETSTLRLSGDAFDSASKIRPGLYARLCVKDTGEGMDRETLDHIFEPFYTTKEKGKGTGLGLSTVYGIIRQSEGHIDVSSERHRGTAFEIFLPSVVEGSKEAEADQTEGEELQAVSPGGKAADQESRRAFPLNPLPPEAAG